MVVLAATVSATAATASGSPVTGRVHTKPTVRPATGAPDATGGDPPHITIAVMPKGTTPGELARVPGMGVGIMSAGIGNVPAEQTFLDMGQGARISPTLYDDPLPLIYVTPPAARGGARIPAPIWTQVRRRAEGAPADIVPGLLGSTLEAAGIGERPNLLAGSAATILADEGGRIDSRCAGGCATVSVTVERPAGLVAMARDLRGRDLLIALERPPPAANHGLAIGIAGSGFAGTLTSDSTRMRGYVVSTDLAPTILDRLGIGVPHQMEGEPIRTDGAVDPAFVLSLENRLAVIGPRRGPVIGTNLVIWVALAALAGVAFGIRGLRRAVPILAVSAVYLPAVLFATAALDPSEVAERLIAGIGCPALALLTLRLVPPLGALAIAGAVSVGCYGVDVIGGSHLTELSLIGPDPAAGVRFYGIGNELEATIAALVPIATGAALACWAPGGSPRRAALAFAATALVAVAAFAPGRFGADVGAAIGLPVGAALAVGVCLGVGRHRLALVIAAPLAAVGALVVADLLLGGNAHLTRSVLRAGGLDQLGNVAERRLVLSAHSFSRYAQTAMFWIAVAAIAVGVLGRRRIEAWFGSRRAAWAGLLGAAGATVAGTLANDSGALLLIIGAALAAATVGLAWATHADRSPR
jgi:hypothetical protein